MYFVYEEGFPPGDRRDRNYGCPGAQLSPFEATVTALPSPRFNEATGQWIYQIEKPTRALTSPYLIDTAGMPNNWPMFPTMLPQNGALNPSVGPFGPVVFCPPS